MASSRLWASRSVDAHIGSQDSVRLGSRAWTIGNRKLGERLTRKATVGLSSSWSTCRRRRDLESAHEGATLVELEKLGPLPLLALQTGQREQAVRGRIAQLAPVLERSIAAIGKDCGSDRKHAVGSSSRATASNRSNAPAGSNTPSESLGPHCSHHRHHHHHSDK